MKSDGKITLRTVDRMTVNQQSQAFNGHRLSRLGLKIMADGYGQE